MCEIFVFCDVEFGKIMYEFCCSEMVVMGEVLFVLYYGGVDMILLFIVFVGVYFECIGDDVLIDELWFVFECVV